MRRRRIAALVVAPVAAALVAGYAVQKWQSRAPIVEAVVADKGDVVQTVSSVSASIQPGTELLIAARRGGRVSSLPGGIGDRVQKGDTLAVISDPVLDAEIAEAVITVERTRKKLDRDRLLSARELIAPAELEASDFDYRAAAARLETLQARCQELTIRAPISGTITAEHVKPGELLGAALDGTLGAQAFPIMVLSTLDDLVVKAYADETDIVGVRQGQEVLVTAEALPETTFAGVVSSVAPAPAFRATGTTYEVAVAIVQPPDRLVTGMRVAARIIVARATNVVRVPKEAVFACEKGRCVFILADNGARRQRVETGISDALHVEIRSGLAAGDRVLVGFPEGLRDGDRIALRGGAR